MTTEMAAEAYRLYARRWWQVELIDLPEHELALIRSLEDEFGKMPDD